MNKRRKTLKLLTINAAIGAVYFVLTVMLEPFSYGQVQFRLSEILMVLVLINFKVAPGIVLGCFTANFFSPLGIWDVVFGTLATVLCLSLMFVLKRNIFVALLAPTVVGSAVVAVMLNLILGLPFLETFIYVAIGEGVVLYVVGIPFYYLVQKNEIGDTLKEL